MAMGRAWVVVGLGWAAAWAAPAMAQRAATPIGSLAEWFGPENYPVEALRAHQEGRVVVILSIDTVGKPSACRVSQSSGVASLDAGTCVVAMRKGFFNPALDRRGRPLPGTFTVPVRWVMPDGAMMPATLDLDRTVGAGQGFHVEVRVTIGPDGAVTSCAVDPPGAEVAGKPGPCGAYPVGKKVMPALTRTGRPIGAQILMRSDMETIFDP